MEITMPNDQASADDTVEFSVALEAHEAEALAQGAFRRIAAALHIGEEQARERAAAMMTEREMTVLVEETVKSRAADAAFATLGTAFLLAPSLHAPKPYAQGQPFTVDVSVFAVPAMKLDLETPIAIKDAREGGLGRDAERNDDEAMHELDVRAIEHDEARTARDDGENAPEHAGESPLASPDTTAGENGGTPGDPSDDAYIEARVLDALRARLHGTVGARLMSAAAAQEHAAFQRALDEAGETYREYRIRTGRKPAQVEEGLREKTARSLHEDIALEIVFREKKLAATPDDEAAVLREMAPENPDALRAEFDNAGKLWMLSARVRRRVALRWAVENLAER